MTKSKFSTISIPGAAIKDVLHYINPIQDGAFSGLLTDRGSKKAPTPSLKSVTRILQL